MIVTIVFNVNVHYFSIRRVLHLDALNDFVNYEQKIERAKRNDLLVVCLTLLLTWWNVF